jgi:hypothetical protein
VGVRPLFGEILPYLRLDGLDEVRNGERHAGRGRCRRRPGAPELQLPGAADDLASVHALSSDGRIITQRDAITETESMAMFCRGANARAYQKFARNGLYRLMRSEIVRGPHVPMMGQAISGSYGSRGGGPSSSRALGAYWRPYSPYIHESISCARYPQ